MFPSGNISQLLAVANRDRRADFLQFVPYQDSAPSQVSGQSSALPWGSYLPLQGAQGSGFLPQS